MIVFDIETGPLPEPELRRLMAPEEPPFDPKSIKPFDPSQVKYGNMKDEVKRAEKLEESRKKHEEESANAEKTYETKRAEKRAQYEANFIDGAALNAMTCRILAIGYRPAGGDPQVQYGDGSLKDEADLLHHFWKVGKHISENAGLLVGHNSKGFDLPVILRRSWLHGILPSVQMLERNRYWAPWILDTMEIWQAGSRDRFTSLEDLARFFGIGEKTGSGADFSRLFLSGDAALRQQAIEYAANDVELTFQLAVRLGVLSGD